MKKLYKGLAAIAVALTLCFALALAACGGSSGSSGINVNFVISDSETQTVTVESGETVEAPEDPTMSGYMFSGWYADKDCTEEFDFATEITKDTNIYAGWIERKDGYVYVTYHLNYEGAGTYSVAEIENGEPLTNTPSPTRDGYRFTTWYLEAACTTEYKGGVGSGKYGPLEEDLDLYAGWYYGYVMEAEYTDLTDELGNARNFNGYSNNYSGTGAILADENCSNGKYVQAGNQPNRYLIFEIKSEVAVSDAYLTINASMDYGYSIAEKNTHDGDQIGSVSVSSEQFQIRVFSESDLEDDMDPQEYTGGTVLSFDTLTFDVSSLTEINTHCAFKTYNISNISLVAGTNYIVLTTTSAAAATSAGGQMTAKSPNLDCITIYSSDASALSQKKYQS